MPEKKSKLKSFAVRVTGVIVPVLLFLILDLLLFFLVLTKQGEILFRDFTFPVNAESFQEYHYPLWDGLISRPNYESIYRLPVRLPFIYLANNGVDMSTVLGIYMLITVLIGQLCFYYFARKKLKASVPVAFAVSFFYGINLRTLDFLWETSLVWGFAFLPLFLYLCFNIFKEKKYKQIPLLSLLLIVISSHPFSVLVTLIISTLLLVLNFGRKNILAFLTVWIIYAFLGAYFLFPIAGTSLFFKVTPESLGHYIVTEDTVNYLSSSSFLNIFIGIREVIDFINYYPNNPVLYIFWIMAAIFPLLLVIYYLFRNYKFRITHISAFALILWITLIALSGGTNGPIAEFYSSLYNTIPNSFAWIVRSPLKWQLYSFFPLFILITLALKKFPKMLPVFVCAMVITTVPTIYGYLFKNFVPVEVPSDYYEINRLLAETNDDYKVIYLPRYDEKATSWSEGRSIQPFDIISSTKPTISYWFNYPRVTQYLYNYYYAGQFVEQSCQLFKPFNINYLVFHNDRLGEANKVDTAFLNKVLEQKSFTQIYGNNGWYLFRLNCDEYFARANTKTVLSGNGLEEVISLNEFLVEFAEKSPDSEIDLKSFYIVDGDLFNEQVLRSSQTKQIIWFGNEEMQRDETQRWAYTLPSSISDFSLGPKLKKYGLENWSNEYFKGAIFTNTSRVLLVDRDFIKQQAPLLTTQDIINFTLEEVPGKEGEFNVPIQNQGGFYEINSPLLKALPENFYLLDTKFNVSSVRDFHIKVKFFTIAGEKIGADLILQKGFNGDFNSGSKDFIKTPPAAEYMKITYSGSHSDTGSRILIEHTQLTDLKQYVGANIYTHYFESKAADSYTVLVRVFANQQGGDIKLSLGESDPLFVNTVNGVNKFLWVKAGKAKLNEGSQSVRLENLSGLNIVSAVALVPENYLNQVEKETETAFATINQYYKIELNSAQQQFKQIINTEGDYSVYLKLLDNTSSAVIKGIGSTEISIITPIQQDIWTKVSEAHLAKGVINISSELNEGARADLLLLPKKLDDTWLQTETVNYELKKINSYEYELTTATGGRGITLTLPETFDQLWVAMTSTQVIQAEPAYGVATSFRGLLPGTTYRIIYTPQLMFFGGLAVSALTLAGIGIYYVSGFILVKIKSGKRHDARYIYEA